MALKKLEQEGGVARAKEGFKSKRVQGGRLGASHGVAQGASGGGVTSRTTRVG